MTVQNFLRTLKTAKRARPSTSTSLKNGALNSSETPFNALINSSLSSSTPSSPSSTPKQNNVQTFLTSLTSHQLNSFLSDPTMKTADCFRIFNLVLHSQSYLSFQPDFHSHFTLVCRLIKSRFFVDAEFLLAKLAVGPNARYPFADFVHHIEKYCKESKIITKMLNMLLKKYSDHGLFDMASVTFDYMAEKGIDCDEKTCSVHLHAMIKADKIDAAFEFFHRMLGTGMNVSVYSLTVVASGLCKIGELKRARELVEEMSGKGTKPNTITFNTLLDACFRRRNIEELRLVLQLMQEEGNLFDEASYKLLVEGYTTSGKVEEAEKSLLEMHEEDFEVESYLYLTVINGYCRLGKTSSALLLFSKMKERQLLPSADLYWSLVSSLCRVGEMGPVKELLIETQKNGLVLDDDLLHTVVGGYQKAGMMDELAGVQRMMKAKCSTVGQNTTDVGSETELVIGDEADLEMMDGLNDMKDDTMEEMVVDDVVKAYVSPDNH